MNEIDEELKKKALESPELIYKQEDWEVAFFCKSCNLEVDRKKYADALSGCIIDAKLPSNAKKSYSKHFQKFMCPHCYKRCEFDFIDRLISFEGLPTIKKKKRKTTISPAKTSWWGEEIRPEKSFIEYKNIE